MSGIVRSVAVDDGDSMRAGDLIVDIAKEDLLSADAEDLVM